MDSLEIVGDASMTSISGDRSVGVSSIESHSEPGIIPTDSGSQSTGTAGFMNAPLSPQRQRSNQTSVTSSPGSVQRTTSTPKNQSPVAPRTQVEVPPHAGIPNLDHGVDGVLLGVQELERQQIALEQRRQEYSPDPHLHQFEQTPPRSHPGFSDDERTEPSSSATGNTAENPAGYTRSDTAATSTFGRLIQTTKKKMTGGNHEESASDEGEDYFKGAIIYGYLQKLGRNGKWQTRWFETDGECLTYYKSSKRSKLLATLDLAKVGSIVINREDPTGCWFTINISARPYHLRADTRAACNDWVITLNRVKEARMQQGNVKLLEPPDLLDHDYTPRVVVVANRDRTRAVDDGEIHSWEAGAWNDPAKKNSTYVTPTSNRLARWQKPRNSLSRLKDKVLRWARSLRKLGCMSADNQVVLDHHVHPPGHDDNRKRPILISPTNAGAADSAWIRKETAADRAGPAVSTTNVLHAVDTDSMNHSSSPSKVDEDDIRELS